MTRPGPKIDLARAARIVVDASEIGDEAAARKHNVSTRTIVNYREKFSGDENFSRLCAELKETIVADWLSSAKAARARLLSRVEALAATTDSLRDAAGALKIVHDAILAEEMLQDGGQPIDRTRMGGAPRAGTPMAGLAPRHGIP